MVFGGRARGEEKRAGRQGSVCSTQRHRGHRGALRAPPPRRSSGRKAGQPAFIPHHDKKPLGSSDVLNRNRKGPARMMLRQECLRAGTEVVLRKIGRLELVHCFPQSWLLTISLGMVLAGTLGNLFDRLVYGAVRDFIKFYVVVDGQPKVWPLLNLADAYICVGVFLLVIETLCFDTRKAEPGSRLVPVSLPPGE